MAITSISCKFLRQDSILTIVEFLAHPGLRPFELAVGLVAALLIVEVIANQLGLSLLGENEAELDLDSDVDLDLDFDTDVDFDVEAAMDFTADADMDLSELADVETDTADFTTDGGFLSWLGIGKVPMIIWLAGTLTAFGLVGYFMQLGVNALFGSPMGAGLAVLIALVPGVALGGRFSSLIGRIFPKHVSTAISRRSYGKRRGVITVGTASSDNPAQARFVDGYGNFHYAMVVPLDTKEEIPEGSQVAIFKARDGVLKAIKITE